MLYGQDHQIPEAAIGYQGVDQLPGSFPVVGTPIRRQGGKPVGQHTAWLALFLSVGGCMHNTFSHVHPRLAGHTQVSESVIAALDSRLWKNKNGICENQPKCSIYPRRYNNQPYPASLPLPAPSGRMPCAVLNGCRNTFDNYCIFTCGRFIRKKRTKPARGLRVAGNVLTSGTRGEIGDK